MHVYMLVYAQLRRRNTVPVSDVCRWSHLCAGCEAGRGPRV